MCPRSKRSGCEPRAPLCSPPVPALPKNLWFSASIGGMTGGTTGGGSMGGAQQGGGAGGVPSGVTGLNLPSLNLGLPGSGTGASQGTGTTGRSNNRRTTNRGASSTPSLGGGSYGQMGG